MRCYVLNLARDVERLAAFADAWRAPFGFSLVRAVDGSRCKLPEQWQHQPGAFGLYATSIATIAANADADEPFAIFEDDAMLVPDWWLYVKTAIYEAPEGWWTINLGAEIEVPGYPQPPAVVGDHLARMPHGWRTHAVVYNPQACGELVLALGARPIPIDQVWCELMLRGNPNFYCTRALLAGTRSGTSRITGISWDSEFRGPLGMGRSQHRAMAA